MHKFIEKLLDGVSVERKKLGEVAKVLRGKRLTRSLLSNNEEYPVYHGGLEPLGYYKDKNRPADTVMIINVGASAGTVGYSDMDFWSSDGCFCVEHSNFVNNKYLYYLLIGYQYLLRSKVRVAGIPTLDAKVVENLQIPLPPIEVQSEIVQILDNFTELTAELTAELSARQKQYRYYRDKLLDFSDEDLGFRVEWKKLGEATQLKRGKRLIKSQLGESGDYAVFQNSMTPLGYYHECNVSGDTAFIISAGVAGEVGYSKDDFWAADDIYYFQKTDSIESKFIYYFLLTQQHKILSQVRRASIPRLSRTVIEKLKIPIPPLEKQKEIVAILDKFDTLTNSISEGLPCEIELRQKQYEYYRDLLLNFPKE